MTDRNLSPCLVLGLEYQFRSSSTTKSRSICRYQRIYPNKYHIEVFQQESDVLNDSIFSEQRLTTSP